jgi:hypothetical protein
VLADSIAQLADARMRRPFLTGEVGAQHPKLTEVGGVLAVVRRTHGGDLLAEMPSAFRPVEQHLGVAAPARGGQPCEDETGPVHRQRGLQVERAEGALPSGEQVEPLGRMAAGLGVPRARSCTGRTDLGSAQSQGYRSIRRQSDRRGGVAPPDRGQRIAQPNGCRLAREARTLQLGGRGGELGRRRRAAGCQLGVQADRVAAGGPARGSERAEATRGGLRHPTSTDRVVLQQRPGELVLGLCPGLPHASRPERGGDALQQTLCLVDESGIAQNLGAVEVAHRRADRR